MFYTKLKYIGEDMITIYKIIQYGRFHALKIQLGDFRTIWLVTFQLESFTLPNWTLREKNRTQIDTFMNKWDKTTTSRLHKRADLGHEYCMESPDVILAFRTRNCWGAAKVNVQLVWFCFMHTIGHKSDDEKLIAKEQNETMNAVSSFF